MTQSKNPLAHHPNAATTIVTGLGLGSVVVQVAAHYGWQISTEWGIAIATGIATAALTIGRKGWAAIGFATRNGALGTWRTVKKLVLHGTGG